MEHCQREVVLSIRVDRHLADVLKGIPNRSEFIRDAIRHALARQCPTCGGTGVLAADPAIESEVIADLNLVRSRGVRLHSHRRTRCAGCAVRENARRKGMQENGSRSADAVR